MKKTSLRALFNEITNLIQGLRDDPDLLCREEMEWRELIQNYLLSLGFKYLAAGAYSKAYVHDGWGGIVFKIAFWGVNFVDLSSLPPKLRQVWLKPLFQSAYVMVQPKVDTGAKKLAWKAVMTALGEDLYEDGIENSSEGYPRAPYDIHAANVGFWRGSPVCFDMMPDCK